MKKLVVFLVCVILLAISVKAVTVSHTADQINPGDYQVGGYNYPDGDVGIGKISPQARLHVSNTVSPANVFIGEDAAAGG